ncbi:CPXCG motif-containing cysteine-rich protein [Aestuariirhabdus sp. Z084]|uniref:CPXCG motif-containing cysteine-rich protein n=1 Tax=Aestuariirhabdus haliotis TaxID=2918751 RepID=UPI00201B388F|nr:CPXCG motif-containing cysteine-rich protein [Aestuariirhabdus haliotis]MCL6417498.1 CPXCG motif-containing cysteine-rich protein [Aestuariirhabdus haliotis]MCL6421458.1 CPXCG motif-containing cysteine-rich protein [Aestuariirhabdus haliotis]
MNPIDDYAITCPWCGESITLVIEVSQLEQSWVEDCSVCCRPIELCASLLASTHDMRLDVRREGE